MKYGLWAKKSDSDVADMSFLHWIGNNCKKIKNKLQKCSVRNKTVMSLSNIGAMTIHPTWPSWSDCVVHICSKKTHFAARPESALSYFGLTMQPELRWNRKNGRRNSGSALFPKPTGPSEDLFMMPPVLEKHHKAIPACVEIRNTDSSIHVTCFVFALRREKNPTGPQSKTCDLLVQETMPRS